MTMSKELIEAGIAKGDYHSIKLRLRELGFNALVVKGAHSAINFRCKRGHQFRATPMSAIKDGCPDCNLIEYRDNAPAPVISFAEFEKSVERQQRFLKKVLATTKRKLVTARGRPPSGRYGI